MKRTLLFLLVLILAGCYHLKSEEIHAEKVTVTVKDFTPSYTTIVPYVNFDGDFEIDIQTTPEIYKVIVEGPTVKWEFDDHSIYDRVEVGQTMWLYYSEQIFVNDEGEIAHTGLDFRDLCEKEKPAESL